MTTLKELADALGSKDKQRAKGILDQILEERKNSPKNPNIDEELVVYVAGPYSPKGGLHDAARVVQGNVEDAIGAFLDVVERGHQAYLPHLSHFVHVHSQNRKTLSYKYYTESDIFWEKKCNSFYFYHPHIGDSSGADNELKIAIEKGDRIFFSKDEIPVYKIGAERNAA